MLSKMFHSLATGLQTAAESIDTLATTDKRDLVKVIKAQTDTVISNANEVIKNSLKEEHRDKIIQDTSSRVSNVFKVSGMFMGKVAHNTLKKAQEGFNSEFNK